MGKSYSIYKKFKFVVEIDGIARAGFMSCSELKAETDNIEHLEGGALTPDNSPGLTRFTPITLTRGVTNDYDLYNWFKDCTDAASDTGLDDPELYRTFDIVQQNRKGEEVERYTVFDTYCRTYSAGDWDNNASENRSESVELVCKRWERVPS